MQVDEVQEKDQRSQTVNEPFGIFNIELTNRCPMRCVMCPRTNNMTRKQGVMDFDLFKQIINELIQENSAYINGEPLWLHHFGESLMHPQFGKFIRYAVAKEVLACLSINPFMLKQGVREELLESKPFMLYISLDGHDDESFQKIRGVKNAYQSSIDNLMHFLELKKVMGSECKIVLSMIDFHLNKQSVEKTQQYWESIDGVDQFLLKSFSTWDGNAKDVSSLAKESGISFEPKKSPLVECNFPWERMTVLWDGEVVPCCNDYNKKLPLGNLKDSTLSEIWNGLAMKSLRAEFISNSVKNPLCRHCDKLRLPREHWDW